MRVLLTGGAGFIGSHVAASLISNNYSIVIYDNFTNSSTTVIDNLSIISGKSVVYVSGDTRDTKLLESTINHYQIDTVMHFAGLKAVSESVINPLKYYENNITGTLSLIRAMNSQNIKNIIFSSSASVYGNPKYLPIDENHPLAPISPYGRTKLIAEKFLEDISAADNKWKVINLRYFNPIGAHSSGLIGEKSVHIPNNLMPYIVAVGMRYLPNLKIFGADYQTHDGTGVRDFIHIEDLVDGHLAALRYLPSLNGFECFNLGTGTGYSVFDLVNEFQKVNNKEIPFEIVGRRSGDIASCYAAVDKAEKILCWKAKKTLSEMCSSSWQYQLKNYLS